jgi:hypothetical protein
MYSGKEDFGKFRSKLNRQFASVVLLAVDALHHHLARHTFGLPATMSDYAHVPGGSLKFKGGGEKWVFAGKLAGSNADFLQKEEEEVAFLF